MTDITTANPNPPLDALVIKLYDTLGNNPDMTAMEITQRMLEAKLMIMDFVDRYNSGKAA